MGHFILINKYLVKLVPGIGIEPTTQGFSILTGSFILDIKINNFNILTGRI